MSCAIDISNLLQGVASASDLLGSSGTISFEVENLRGTTRVKLFSIRGDCFHFEARIADGGLIVERNGHQAVSTFDASRLGDWRLFVAWSPVQLTACCSFVEPSPRLNRICVDTLPTIAPRALIVHAKSLKLATSLVFATTELFREAVHHVVRDLLVDLRISGVSDALWDKSYSGARLTGKRPKRETDIHPLINWHLRDWAELRGVQIVPEAQTAVGRLDFALQGHVHNVGIETFCIEFKHAHAKDLVHGLEVQLPIYMEQLRAKYGAYVMMWFKCPSFQKPSKRKLKAIGDHWRLAGDQTTPEIEQLGFFFGCRVSKGVLNSIRVFTVDATAPVPASRA